LTGSGRSDVTDRIGARSDDACHARIVCIAMMKHRPPRTAARMASLLALATTLVAQPASAQWGVWAGDSLLASGRLRAAESAYYAAVRAQPRDPIARAALGKYLAARGATLVAVVLLEEARDFGGDSAALARTLAPMYTSLRNYSALLALKPDVLSSAERQRARWLASNAPSVAFGDSVVLLTYRPAANGTGIGTVLIRLGRTELPAIIDPRVSGLVLPSSLRGDVRTFGTSGETLVAVTPSLRIGALMFSNVPTTVAEGGTVRVGFDVLSRHAPSFDPVRGILVLRRGVARRDPPVVGSRVPALYDTNGLRLLIGGRWQPTSAGLASMMLATRAWMWDAKRGDVVLLSQ
jgi:hypothetical protein